MNRVHAVIALIKARHSIGAETDATMEMWNNIAIFKEFDREGDERMIDIVLVELEKRKDAEWLGEYYPSSPFFHCVLANMR